MNDTVKGSFLGALGTIAVGAIVYGSIRFSKATRELIIGLAGIGSIAETNKQLVETGRMVAIEVQLLRSMMAANVAPQPGGDGQDPREVEAGPSKPQPRAPFPTAPADFFREVPDAQESDTEIIDTTDEQLVSLERIEELRQQGHEADPAELEIG